MIMLEGIKIAAGYKEQDDLFSDVSLHVNAGECVALTGPSGCGKTTLCQILSGIRHRSTGGDCNNLVMLMGENILQLSFEQIIRRVGIVFQNPDSQLFSPTVEDELAFGPENICVERDEIGRRITHALKTVGMERYRFENPSRLSGGQKQLIALAAVLTLEPMVLVFDEALSQLDSESTNLVKEVILRLKSEGKAILMVEHDEENIDIADRQYVFENKTIKEVAR